jgi:hypothetical protein
MKFDARSTIEIIGGVAVVLSLLFVGLQLQQSNSIAEREARSEIPFLTMDINRLALEEPEIASLLVKLSDRSNENFTKEEQHQAYSLAGMYLNLWAVTSSAVDSGFVPENVLSIYLGNVRIALEVYPGLCPFLLSRVTENMRNAQLNFISAALAELEQLDCSEWTY